MKIRPNSLLGKLTEDQRDQVFIWLLEDNKSLDEVSQACAAAYGVRASAMAFSRLLSSHGVSWRVERAREAATAAMGTLPANADELQRQALARSLFEKSFRDLSIKELHLLGSMELEKEKLALKKQEMDLKRAGLELRVREFEERFASARAALAKVQARGGIAPETLADLEKQLRMM
jgi:hypothetical protein